jgi:uncharacterized membrane protein YtjA (UPF0391 family)
MLSWAIVFLIVAIIAGVLGLSSAAAASTHLAWALFAVFIALFVIAMLTGRHGPRPQT